MTALMRLYPRAWRDRYEDEFLGVLAEAPPSFLDRIDIVFGAIDARLHPEVPGDARPTETDVRRAPPSRRAALAAVTGGLIWAAGGIALVLAPKDLYGDTIATVGMVLFAIGSLCLAGAVIAAADVLLHRATAERAIGVGLVVASALLVMPWPLLFFGALAVWVLTAVFGGLLALQGARLIGLLLLVASTVALGMNTEDARALFTIPFGVAWILLGVGLAAGLRLGPTASPRGG